MLILVNAVVGIIQLIIAVILAVVALYIGFSVFGKVTKNVDEQKELAKGNVAFGIVVAAIFVAIAVVVQSGVAGISVGISKASALGLTSVDGLIVICVAIIQLVLGVLLAIGAIYLALNILDKLTKGVEEFEELKKGNVAVALEMAGVIIAVALIIQSGIVGITTALA
ncbi:MAG: DUF350 domain-containing protein [Methanoregula sp.]|jgi:uncharacterized membrane protein YjfL (UPF0719 family)|uniref:DUF350 domain-containing protein n=1 Tax=Methanoregula sp. TaxID=2052170 RepID=UPI003C18A244